MQVWTSAYGMTLGAIKGAQAEGWDARYFEREVALSEFFRSSKEASPTKTSAKLDMWVEWVGDDETHGACLKGVLVGKLDGGDSVADNLEYLDQIRQMFDPFRDEIFQVKYLKESGVEIQDSAITSLVQRMSG